MKKRHSFWYFNRYSLNHYRPQWIRQTMNHTSIVLWRSTHLLSTHKQWHHRSTIKKACQAISCWATRCLTPSLCLFSESCEQPTQPSAQRQTIHTQCSMEQIIQMSRQVTADCNKQNTLANNNRLEQCQIGTHTQPHLFIAITQTQNPALTDNSHNINSFQNQTKPHPEISCGETANPY